MTRTSGAGRSGIRVDQAMELLEVHAVVDADPEQPIAAAKAADERMLETAALRLQAVDASRCLADRAAGLVQQDQQLLGGGVRGSGHRWRDDRRVILGPRGAGVERCPRRQEASAGGRMSERLRRVPVLLAAGSAEKGLRKLGQDRLKGIPDRFLLGQDARRTADYDPCTQLAAERPEW